VGHLTQEADAAGKIVWSDKGRIEALHAQYPVNIVDGFPVFDLNYDSRLEIGRL
jgi:hypothetical protein